MEYSNGDNSEASRARAQAEGYEGRHDLDFDSPLTADGRDTRTNLTWRSLIDAFTYAEALYAMDLS